MLSFAALSLTLFLQNLSLTDAPSWEDLAKPWMTAEERLLYDGLDAEAKNRFAGYFIARRLEDRRAWGRTGLYLPLFFHPKDAGDIRDQIAYLLGKPLQEQPMAQNPKLPARWVFNDYQFHFILALGGGVDLHPDSHADWERLKQSLILHPDVRYDLQTRRFGRNRLPQDLQWLNAKLAYRWSVPDGKGATVRLGIKIPAAFNDLMAQYRGNQTQNMEMLIFLKKDPNQPVELVSDDYVRHGNSRANLKSAQILEFEAHLPEGYHHGELLIYSGFLPFGIRVSAKFGILPASLARIGDPVVCDSWQKAGIEVPPRQSILAGGRVFRPATGSVLNQPLRVLVHTSFPETWLWLSDAQGRVLHKMQPSRQHDKWAEFQLPPQSSAFRLLALARPANASQWAVSQWGTAKLGTGKNLSLGNGGLANYLTLETLDFQGSRGLNLLFVNKIPYLGSETGQFPWTPVDWGLEAKLRVEFVEGQSLTAQHFAVKRNRVFQEIKVKPKFIVAGTRQPGGLVKQVPFEVRLLNQKVPQYKKTPLAEMDKLWGIVVNDPLLMSPSWPKIRGAVVQWLKNHTRQGDFLYVVHISHRPELVLPPTPIKALVEANLKALTPKARTENLFTVQYLINALTHLPLHQLRPHQVLLLTHQLTGELQQMEQMLATVRKTGLQIYNLEFPFEFSPESEQRFKETQGDPLLAMGLAQEKEDRLRQVTKDNAQDRGVVPFGFKFNFGKGAKKRKTEAQQEAIREQAFRQAFNTQIGNITAGLALKSGFGETTQSLHKFLDDLALWQQNLVHIELPVPIVDEEMVGLQAEPGYTVAWTLVDWQPPEVRVK